jgi:hypothetical protein
MNRGHWQGLVDQLRGAEYQFGVIAPASPRHRIEFDAGLTGAEVTAVETRFGFLFPPDLRDFLQTALPRGPRFPDWRSGDDATLRDWLDQPRQGVLFDVEHNGFWLNAWGPRPGSLKEALRVADELVAAAPRLIPLYGHRMMPDEPHQPGNPVFSVHQDGHHPLRIRLGRLPPRRVPSAGPRAVAGDDSPDPVLGFGSVP